MKRSFLSLLIVFGFPVVAGAQDGLLINKIVVTPTAGEVVEIINTTGISIDLTDVYLTDATFSGGSIYYYEIVAGGGGGGDFSDFHARFPAGATLAGGATARIALNGSTNFLITYGFNPDYELYEDGVPDGIPDMLEATAGSINGQGGLSNQGEVVILYHWNGTTDLVQDLDYVVWGDKLEAVDKTGVAIDGPDVDAVTTPYLADTAIANQDPMALASHAVGNSWTRIDTSEGTEFQAGGNGIAGDDETSENTSVTFAEQAIPVGVPDGLLINEIVVTPVEGEAVEIVNTTGSPIDLTNVYLTDATFAGGSIYYYNIVTGYGGGGGIGDFNARFPGGATLAGGATARIALNGSTNFFVTYGFNPDYELYEDGVPDGVPDMLEATAGSINGQGGLSNQGEVVILYFWDRSTDLVQDLDYVVWGDKAEAVDKTGVAVDGPDVDAVTSTYAADTVIASQDPVSLSSHAEGNSWTRIDPSEGTETQAGGNGIAGDNETSENTSVTFNEQAQSVPVELQSFDIE